MGKAEAHVEGYFVKKATDLGAMVRKVEWVSRKGCPDRFVALKGFYTFIEFKSPEGQLSEHQKAEIDLMKSTHKVNVFVISTREEADQLLGLLTFIAGDNSLARKNMRPVDIRV